MLLYKGVAPVDVVVQKVIKNLFVVANPINDIWIESRYQDDIFVEVSSLENVHELEDLLQEK